MTEELIDFPDGGRATLVRRFSPPLTAGQLDILRRCPYEVPAKFDHRRRPRQLVALGLLEEHPDSGGVFRVTEAGADILRIWEAAGFKP